MYKPIPEAEADVCGKPGAIGSPLRLQYWQRIRLEKDAGTRSYQGLSHIKVFEVYLEGI